MKPPEVTTEAAEESRWLRQVLAGGRQQREALVALQRRYGARKFLPHLRHSGVREADHEDVLQEIWLAVVRSAANYQDQGTPSAWLWRIARLKIVDWLRAQGAHGARGLQFEPYDSAGADTVADRAGREAARRTELARCLKRAFDRFGEKDRQGAMLLRLVYLEHWTITQVAEYRDSSVPAATEYLSQLRKKFKDYSGECNELREATEPSMPDQPPPAPAPADNFSDSDRQWFDRLSGRLTEGGDSDALREADDLRAALSLEQAEDAADPALLAAQGEAAEARRQQQLLFRMKREGLLDAAAPPRWRQWPALVGLAAAVVLGTLVVPWWRAAAPDYDDAPTLRGDAQTLVSRQADPRQAAERLAQALREAGLKAGLYQRGQIYIVDVDLQADELAAAAPAFGALGLTPRPGYSRIEIRTP